MQSQLKDILIAFFYDLFFLQRHTVFLRLVKVVMIPVWIWHRYIYRRPLNVFFIHTEVFGIALGELQSLHQFANDSVNKVYFNYHPIISGRFVISLQLSQIDSSPNIFRLRHRFILARIYADSIDLSFSEKFQKNRFFIMSSLRDLKYHGACLFNMSRFDPLPFFSTEEIQAHKISFRNHFKTLKKDTFVIAVHSRTGNFAKYKEPRRIFDQFRNTSFDEISHALAAFNSRQLQHFRIGHPEIDLIPVASTVLDGRIDINFDSKLQLDAFISCDAYFGSSSGPVSFFVNQKKPCLLVSVYPIDVRYPSDPKLLIVIPKIIWNLKEKRYLSLKEQFGKSFSAVQNLYDDRLLVQNFLKPISIPKEITNRIYADWAKTIVLAKNGSGWIDASQEATTALGESVGRQHLPFIPIQYFDFMDSLQNS